LEGSAGAAIGRSRGAVHHLIEKVSRLSFMPNVLPVAVDQARIRRN